jgi:hypothetical protein
LAQEPGAFVANPAVKNILDETGGDGLPIITLNDAVVSQGSYPTRAALARLAGIDEESGLASGPLVTPTVGELIAIGQPPPPTAKLAVIHVANNLLSEEGPADNGCAPNSGCCG